VKEETLRIQSYLPDQIDDWFAAIASAAQKAAKEAHWLPSTPAPATYQVGARYVLEMPKSLPKYLCTAHFRRPDLLRLHDVIAMALGATVWESEANVDSISITKRYAEEGDGAPAVHITVTRKLWGKDA
jgi:hypothetical protein